MNLSINQSIYLSIYKYIGMYEVPECQISKTDFSGHPNVLPLFCHLYRLLEGAYPEGVHDGVEGSFLETWEPPMGSLWDPGNGRPIIGVSPFVPFKMVF